MKLFLPRVSNRLPELLMLHELSGNNLVQWPCSGLYIAGFSVSPRTETPKPLVLSPRRIFHCLLYFPSPSDIYQTCVFSYLPCYESCSSPLFVAHHWPQSSMYMSVLGRVTQNWTQHSRFAIACLSSERASPTSRCC